MHSWPERRMRSTPRSVSERSVIDQRAVGLFVQDQDHAARHPHARARDALRVARHAHGAGRPVRRLRRGERVAGAGRRRTSTRSISRTIGTSSRGWAWPGISRLTAARCCAPPMAGRGRTGHDGCSRHRRESAIRRAAHSDRLDSPHERDRDDAARRPRPGDGRSPVPERVDAVVECERATATRPRLGRDARILRLPRHEPSDLAQYQSACRRRSALRRRVGLQPDSSWHSAR